MKQTPYLRLKLPDYTDRADVQDLNDNFTAIDTEIQRVASKAGDISSGTVYSNVAGSRTNVDSGDTLGTAMGKIRKWFTDLKDGAFSTVANNLTTTAAGYVADARALKGLADRVIALETSFPAGCRKIAAAITGGRDGKGTGGVSTASTASPDTMATNITKLASDNYSAGVTAAQNVKGNVDGIFNGSNYLIKGTKTGYVTNGTTYQTKAAGSTPQIETTAASGVKDISVTPGIYSTVKVNQTPAYNAGVSYADGRVNTNSTNYQSGYTAGANSVLGVTSTNKGTFHFYKNYGEDGWGHFSFPVPQGANTIHYSGVWVNYGDAAHPTASIGNGASVVSYRGQYINVCYSSNKNSEFDGSFWFA